MLLLLQPKNNTHLALDWLNLKYRGLWCCCCCLSAFLYDYANSNASQFFKSHRFTNSDWNKKTKKNQLSICKTCTIHTQQQRYTQPDRLAWLGLACQLPCAITITQHQKQQQQQPNNNNKRQQLVMEGSPKIGMWTNHTLRAAAARSCAIAIDCLDQTTALGIYLKGNYIQSQEKEEENKFNRRRRRRWNTIQHFYFWNKKKGWEFVPLLTV